MSIYEHAKRREDGTSAIEFNGTLQLDNGGSISLGDGGIELLESFVVVGDVSLVVLLVMNLHDLSIYGRLKSAIVVREIGKGEGL